MEVEQAVETCLSFCGYDVFKNDSTMKITNIEYVCVGRYGDNRGESFIIKERKPI